MGSDPAEPAADSPGWVGTSFADRYLEGALIGRGGMGEVRSARDRRVGRDVAIKRLRAEPPTPAQMARFLREARVQGRLEHPAVVPIHDVGLDDSGRPYLVMKRVDGTTLADVVRRRAPAAELERWPRRALLGAFAQVCLAVDFAHHRGVVHRDLKPANVLLGSFGEVYVLDWGIARLLDEPADGALPGAAPRAARQVTGDVDLPSSSETAAGSVLGTPGYMAPEQRRGDPDVDGRADVYALGCILFEILTGHPMASPSAPTETAHGTGTSTLPSTLEVELTRPAIRYPHAEVPPELDAVCAAACATDPAERPTARAVHDALQRYLDGDRDLARRRELAAGHAAVAQGALVGPGDDQQRRATAMREAGAALALDPAQAEAAAIASRLLLEPPAEPLPAVADELAAEREDMLRTQGKNAIGAYLAYLAVVPLLFLLGLRSTLFAVAMGGVLVIEIGLCLVSMRQQRIPAHRIYWLLLGDVVLLYLLGRIGGPLFLVPAQVTGMTMLYIRSTANRRPAIFAIAITSSVVVPMALELLGVLPASYQFADGAMIVRSSVIDLAAAWTIPTMLVLLVVNVWVITAIAASVQREHADTGRRLRNQAWHLRHLVRRPGDQSR
jgi:hypothetical protein